MAALLRGGSQLSTGGSFAGNPDVEVLKDEVRAFGRAFKDALDAFDWSECVPQGRRQPPAASQTSQTSQTADPPPPPSPAELRKTAKRQQAASSFHALFKALWKKGAVGPTMKQRPSDAARLMKRWAVGKLKPSQATAFRTAQVMQPDKSDDRYALRRKYLLSFVVIRLFAEASASYFSLGPCVFFESDAAGLKHLMKCLEGEKSDRGGGGDSANSPGRPSEGEDMPEEPSLFDADDMDDLRMPLSARTFAGASSQESSTPLLSIRAGRSKFSFAAEEHSMGGGMPRQDTSFSCLSPDVQRAYKWPVSGMLHSDPVSQDVLDEVVGWLRLAIIAIDVDPQARHTDHQVEDYGGDASDFKVYPLEQALNATLCVTFGVTLPLTLEALYRTLEISVKSSKVLQSCLSLREMLTSLGGTWVAMHPTAPQTPTRSQQQGSQGTGPPTPTLIQLRKTSLNFAETQQPKRRRSDTPGGTKEKKRRKSIDSKDNSQLLAAELQKMSARKRPGMGMARTLSR